MSARNVKTAKRQIRRIKKRLLKNAIKTRTGTYVIKDIVGPAFGSIRIADVVKIGKVSKLYKDMVEEAIGEIKELEKDLTAFERKEMYEYLLRSFHTSDYLTEASERYDWHTRYTAKDSMKDVFRALAMKELVPIYCTSSDPKEAELGVRYAVLLMNSQDMDYREGREYINRGLEMLKNDPERYKRVMEWLKN